MTEIAIPKDLQQLAAKLGAKVGPQVTYDGHKAVQNLHAQFHGGEVDFTGEESDIGCCFGSDEESEFGSLFSRLKKIAKGVGKGIGSVGKVVGKVASVGVFAIPGIGPIAGGALQAADKLLGGKKGSKVNQAIINNTKALAALGDPAAIRGAQALATVSQIRTQNNTPPGKSVIPGAHAATPVKPYIRPTPQIHVAAVAQQLPAKKRTKWQAFKEWFTGHPATEVKKAA